MAWAPSAFIKMTDEECAEFLYSFMKNTPKTKNCEKAYKNVMHYIIGSFMVQDEYKIISDEAKIILAKKGIAKPSTTKSYSAIGLRQEHTIPISFISNYFQQLPENKISLELITKVVKAVRGISLITVEEDNYLNSINLKSSLPDGCTIDMMLGGNPEIPYAIRYIKAGIKF